MTTYEALDPVRAALYLDFDNLYAGLEGECLSKAFSRRPRNWLTRIETGWGAPASGRRILVARAYLNPAIHSSHRRHLTNAGFEVIDTPSLTAQRKSAADIRLTIDMLDALSGPVHYDEFIVLSGDADFTPVLYRLRASDRRTMIVSSRPVAAAYRHVADIVVDRGSLPDFLGAPSAPAAPAPAPATEAVSSTPVKLPAPAEAAVPEPVEAAIPAPIAIDPVPTVLAALATVIESGRAFDGSLAEAVVVKAAAGGQIIAVARVKKVLAVFREAGVDVRLAAEPTAFALQRTYDALRESGQAAA